MIGLLIFALGLGVTAAWFAYTIHRVWPLRGIFGTVALIMATAVAAALAGPS